MRDEKPISWEELPPKLTSLILLRLGTVKILLNAQRVCKSWHHICKDPSMWRKIDIFKKCYDMESKYYLLDSRIESICRHAVDRSQGGLSEIHMWNYGTNRLIKYIADSSSNLRSLELVRCCVSDYGVVKAATKLPLLEDLRITYCQFSGDFLRDIGKSCSNLKTLKLNRNPASRFLDDSLHSNAIAIAESMPKLRHLQLLGNRITNLGLKAILDGCPHLEHLDLRQCFYINLSGDLEKQCLERIKDLRRPNDSTPDFPFRTSHLGVFYLSEDVIY